VTLQDLPAALTSNHLILRLTRRAGNGESGLAKTDMRAEPRTSGPMSPRKKTARSCVDADASVQKRSAAVGPT